MNHSELNTVPPEKFRLESFLTGNEEAFHVARTTISSGNDLVYHRHNYAEVFWIKQGRGYHRVNGCETVLTKGTLVMIRPWDAHTFRIGKERTNLVVTNIAFYAENLDIYRARYFPDSDSCFWEKGQLPFSFILSSEQLNELSTLVDRLFTQPRDYLHLDYLMIHIFKILLTRNISGEHLPFWLAFALDNYNSPEQFKNGISEFVSLTKRSVDHVNRTLKQHLKQTLTETVNKARLEYAARQLTLTNAAIKKISDDCGFENISYFHRIFKKFYGITPREYRRRNQNIF